MKAKALWLFWLILLCCGMTACPTPSPRTMPQPERLAQKMEILTILPDSEQSFLIVLATLDGQHLLPISIGWSEAQAIALEMEQVQVPRPLTHDLAQSAIEVLGGHVEEVLIDALQEQTFLAKIVLLQGGDRLRLDARPSDAIALAMKFKAPIWVAESVLNTAGVDRGLLGEDSLEEQLGLWVQDLDPELANYFQLEANQGVLVVRVEPGGIAAQAGLQSQDLLLSLDSLPLTSGQVFLRALREHPGDTPLSLVLLRDGAQLELSLALPVHRSRENWAPLSEQDSRDL